MYICLGSIEEHEYFGEVLLGIKHVIQNHLREVQVKFQDRCLSLEMDVKERDIIITQLQRRIYELEHSGSVESNKFNRCASSPGTGSTGSSGDMPFVVIFNWFLFISFVINLCIFIFLQRGDSVDTIFVSSPPDGEYDRCRAKHKSKKRSSPRRKTIDLSREESTDQETSLSHQVAESMRSYRGVMVANASSHHYSEISESVVLNIDNSSHSNSSSSESHLEEEDYNEIEGIDDDDDDDDDDGDGRDGNDDEDDEGEAEGDDDLHCDDWEIRMLAAELNRRESKKEEISSEGYSDPDEAGRLLRRRRRKNELHESDTECSENDINDRQEARPRAASLDQHNIRRQTCTGVFKAMSFDRDKDRL